MQKLKSILFSTRLTATLFIVFALAMAAGTFIESYYNTITARIWIYNAWWFEAIIIFFVINFFGNISRYQLYKKEKWATLILHLSFIFIIIGAFITRYVSYEGMMLIRENESSNKIYSEKSFLSVIVYGQHKGQTMQRTFEKPLLLSPAVFSPFASNNFSINSNFNKTPFSIKFKDFIMDKKETVLPNKNGKLYIKLVESSGGKRNEHFLEDGQIQSINGILFTLNKHVKGAINIVSKLGFTSINSPFDGNYMRMADKLQGTVIKNNTNSLAFRSLYNIANTQFVFPDQPIVGIKKIISGGDFKSKNSDDALILELTSQNKTKEITLIGSIGKQGEPQTFKIGELEFSVAFGSKVYQTPFSIKLNDFIAEKYPGSENSYSSFKSKVTVLDTKSFNQDIFMNHILDHKGYRFFQAGFDPDEKRNTTFCKPRFLGNKYYLFRIFFIVFWIIINSFY